MQQSLPLGVSSCRNNVLLGLWGHVSSKPRDRRNLCYKVSSEPTGDAVPLLIFIAEKLALTLKTQEDVKNVYSRFENYQNIPVFLT